MYLSDSFTTALAAAHRDDLLAAAERHRTARHVRAAVAAARSAAGRARGPAALPRPDPVPAPAGADGAPVHPGRNGDANRRYAVSR